MHFVADRAIAGPGLPPNGRIAACGEVRNAGFAPPLSGCQPRGKAKFGMNGHAGTKYVLGIPLLAACVGFIGFIHSANKYKRCRQSAFFTTACMKPEARTSGCGVGLVRYCVYKYR